MISINQIEYHVVDACNLACEYCSHYSNFKGPANVKPVSEIAEEWQRWAKKIAPKRFHIIGGEPLLHPDICEIVKLAFRAWPESEIILYSNGLLLKNHPGLRGSLKGGMFALGLHFCDERDKQTESVVRNYFFGSGVEVGVVDGAVGWMKFYDIVDGKPVPFRDNDQRSSWSNCVAAQQRCFVLRNDRLWKCPQVAFADRAKITWFHDYDACPIDGDIQAWVKREDEPCCANCPAQETLTPHGAAYMKSRIAVETIAVTRSAPIESHGHPTASI